MKIIEELIRAGQKNPSINFESKEFINFITNAKTINLYHDTLSTYIAQNFITDKQTTKNGTFETEPQIDFETIGKMFFALTLYKLKPTTYYNKETKQLLKLDKDQQDQMQELINIYNQTMIKPYQNSKNSTGKGAPKGNTNAKKKAAATDYETDQDTNYSYE